MGQISSRIVDEIGQDAGQPSFKLRDVEYTVELVAKEFPSLNLGAFKKVFEERNSMIKQGKEKASRASLKASVLRELVGKTTTTGNDSGKVHDIIKFLETNKVFQFFATMAPNLDMKNFSRDKDGFWHVKSAPEGSQLTTYDTIIDIIHKGENHTVKGTSSEQFMKLLKMRPNHPCLRVHRKTSSKIEMYGALRMPPPSIKLTLWDMDLCLLRIHTGGHTNEKIQGLSKEVTEPYVYLLDLLIHRGRDTGVVTFSDKQVAKATNSSYGGEDLVRPLVYHALRRHWMKQDRELKLEDAMAKARSFVEKNLYVRAAYPEWRNRNDPEFKQNPMPNSKEWHIQKVLDDYKDRTGVQLKNSEVILFDDDERNISEAIEQDVIAVQVDCETGFCVRDWDEAMNLAWAKYLEAKEKGQNV